MRPTGRGGQTDLCRWLLRLAVVFSILLWRGRSAADQIVYGRCYAYCLRTHLARTPDRGRGGHNSNEDEHQSVVPDNAIKGCQEHYICRWCLYVCDRPEENYTDSESCRRDCGLTRTRPSSSARQACSDACGFVGRASSSKGGTCPAPVALSGFESACVTSCHADRNCDKAAEKCCSNGCGSVCTEPEDLHILPPMPEDISFKLLQDGGVVVRWASRGEAVTSVRRRSQDTAVAPVVYVLRWWCPYTSGAITAVVDRARTKIEGLPYGIYPGVRCSFMVAAINVHGSRGFSPVHKYVKKFVKPSPPRNLDKAEEKIHDGKIDVTIQWQPPVYTDSLPVDKYQISWSDKLPKASPQYMRLHMHRKIINGESTSFTLYSLEPGNIYFVQVSAIVKWKENRKIGKAASTYVETFSPPQQANQTPVVHQPYAESAIQRVQVNQSYFHDSVLKTAVSWTLKPGRSARKYLIYWRQEACAMAFLSDQHQASEASATSHERSFTLYNLKPDCEYAVRVHPVNSRGLTGAATVASFVTPPCRFVYVLQGEAPTCDTADPPGKVRGLHSETSQCVTVVRWEPVTTSPSQAAVTSYEVTWGETAAGNFSSTVVFSSAPHNTSVPYNQTYMTLGALRPGQHYSVQVSALSPRGSGDPAVLPLHVPHPSSPCPSHLRSPEVGEEEEGEVGEDIGSDNGDDVTSQITVIVDKEKRGEEGGGWRQEEEEEDDPWGQLPPNRTLPLATAANTTVVTMKRGQNADLGSNHSLSPTQSSPDSAVSREVMGGGGRQGGDVATPEDGEGRVHPATVPGTPASASDRPGASALTLGLLCMVWMVVLRCPLQRS